MRLSLDAPLKLGRTVLPAHADVHYAARSDGSKQLDAAARLSFNFNRFNLGSTLHYQKQYLPSGLSAPSQLDLELIGTARVRRRAASWRHQLRNLAHCPAQNSAELSAYWSASENADWEGDLIYEADVKRARARVWLYPKAETMAIALTGEAASDGSVAFGINLNFSLDPRHGLNFSRLPLAHAGTSMQPSIATSTTMACMILPNPRKGRADHHRNEVIRPTDRPKGTVTLAVLSAYSPIAVESTKPASTTRCWSQRKRCRSWFQGPAFRPKSKSALSAAATSRARWSRTAVSGSKGSISNWSMQTARWSERLGPTWRLLPFRTGRLRKLLDQGGEGFGYRSQDLERARSAFPHHGRQSRRAPRHVSVTPVSQIASAASAAANP